MKVGSTEKTSRDVKATTMAEYLICSNSPSEILSNKRSIALPRDQIQRDSVFHTIDLWLSN